MLRVSWDGGTGVEEMLTRRTGLVYGSSTSENIQVEETKFSLHALRTLYKRAITNTMKVLKPKITLYYKFSDSSTPS